MTPKQREAAERLVFEQWYDSQPEGRINPWDVWQAASSRRELAAEPVQEPVIWIQSNHLQHAKNGPHFARTGPTKLLSDYVPLYAAPQQRKPLPLPLETVRVLVKECGLDWHRGFVPLFDGDETNRYEVLIRAVEHGITGEPT